MIFKQFTVLEVYPNRYDNTDLWGEQPRLLSAAEHFVNIFISLLFDSICIVLLSYWSAAPDLVMLNYGGAVTGLGRE